MKAQLKLATTLSLVLLLSLEGCNAQQSSIKKTDVEKEGLRGKVKSVRELAYEAAEKNGEIVKVELYDPPHCYVEVREREYDIKGNLILYKELTYEGGVELEEKYQYSDEGLLIRVEFRNYIGPRDGDYREYDEDSFLETIYKYDKEGDLIDVKEYYEGKEVEGMDVQMYTITGYNEDTVEYKCKYNKEGKLIEKVYNDYRETIETFKYTNEGKEVKTFYRGELSAWDKYDNEEKLIEYHEISDGKITRIFTYDYKYDKTGNWVDKIEKYTYPPFDSQSKEYRITERTITYYE